MEGQNRLHPMLPMAPFHFWFCNSHLLEGKKRRDVKSSNWTWTGGLGPSFYPRLLSWKVEITPHIKIFNSKIRFKKFFIKKKVII